MIHNKISNAAIDHDNSSYRLLLHHPNSSCLSFFLLSFPVTDEDSGSNGGRIGGLLAFHAAACPGGLHGNHRDGGLQGCHELNNAPPLVCGLTFM